MPNAVWNEQKNLAYNRCSNTSKRQVKTRLGGNFTIVEAPKWESYPFQNKTSYK